MQNTKLLNIKEYQYDRTINWLLEINRNNSYFPNIIPLRNSPSSSSLSLLEKQCLQLKYRRKRKQIISKHNSNSSLSTTVILERNQQVLSNTICNTIDMLNEHIHNLTYIEHLKRSSLPQIQISSNTHEKNVFSIRSSYFFLIIHYIFPIFYKIFFLV